MGFFALTSCGNDKAEDNSKDDHTRAASPDESEPRGFPDENFFAFEQEGALSNLQEIIDSLALKPYHQAGYRGQGLTIAVLDNGFSGWSQSIGRYLPPETTLLPSPGTKMATTTHGTKMAEIAYAVATGRTDYSATVPGPRMLLLNTNGFTNLKAAVDQVIAAKADIVLYAQVWEYGGNGDGGGFINREVNRATKAGVLWINAAGNVGQSTWSGPLRFAASDGAVALPHQKRYVRFAVPADGTAVKIVLSWNDFDASKDYHTPQDLDLILEDEAGKELAAGRLVQNGAPDAGTAPSTSAHAREIIQGMLKAGIYRLRVEARSRNFVADSRLRLTVDGHRVVLLDKSTEDSLLIPADNPTVVAIGASDTNVSGRNFSNGKPEFALPSRVVFESGITHTGTSAATAIAVGALASFQSAYGRVDRAKLLELASQGIIALPPPAERSDNGPSILRFMHPSRL